jgi:hypothetical protein
VWYPYLASDYLIVTRLPNFLSPDFDEAKPDEWSYLLVIGGGHGFGTRAIELLLRPDNMSILEALAEQLRNEQVFQILFEAGDVQVDSRAVHVAHAIQLLDVVPLRHEPERYATARQHVEWTLDLMLKLVNAQEASNRCAWPIPTIPQLWHPVPREDISSLWLNQEREGTAEEGDSAVPSISTRSTEESADMTKYPPAHTHLRVATITDFQHCPIAHVEVDPTDISINLVPEEVGQRLWQPQLEAIASALHEGRQSLGPDHVVRVTTEQAGRPRPQELSHLIYRIDKRLRLEYHDDALEEARRAQMYFHMHTKQKWYTASEADAFLKSYIGLE